jgi:hypothetical protein
MFGSPVGERVGNVCARADAVALMERKVTRTSFD